MKIDWLLKNNGLPAGMQRVAVAKQTEIKTTDYSRIYRREMMSTLTPADNSRKYSWSQARDIFEEFPTINLVEYVSTGNKTDSQLLKRGQKYAPKGCYVIICSTGGKWGKSRREYKPL